MFDFDFLADPDLDEYFFGDFEDDEMEPKFNADISAPCEANPWKEMIRVLCGDQPLDVVAAALSDDESMASEMGEDIDLLEDEPESTAPGDEVADGQAASAGSDGAELSSASSDHGQPES
mmetsp:Transcript_35108/g.82080  ORF Transcript_35108/g.82080 Transcript_35108/m.82080 type:complete len:120 (+) Transcript_35108:86-445(+)